MMLSNNNFKTFNFLRTLLIQPLTFSFSKRFMHRLNKTKEISQALCNIGKMNVPLSANNLGIKLTQQHCKTILHVLNKNNVLTAKLSDKHLLKLINNLSETTTNRAELFKRIREIITNKEITLPTDVIVRFPTLMNELASAVRTYHIPEKINNLSAQEINKQKGIEKPVEKMSRNEKQEAFFKEHDNMVIKMTEMKNNYEQNKSIAWKSIEEWHQYLENRGTIILHYTPEEIAINTFLKILFQENTKPKDIILSQLDDKLQQLKIQSNLSNTEWLTQMQEKCFSPDDYMNKIKVIKEVLTMLKKDIQLNDKALLLLAIYSKAMVLDEEYNPKLTREVYELIKHFPELFKIKYTTEKPDPNEIFYALENKMYLIKQSSSEIPEGYVVSTAPLLHKTILINTQKGLYCVAMFTSSKTNTESLSLTQECNLDPESANKEQRFVVYSPFILCNDTKITIDLLALGFTHATNLEGEDVHQKIIQIFKDKQNDWGNNFVQELFIINSEVIRDITIMFFKENLNIIEKEYQALNVTLDMMSEKEKKEYVAELINDKNNEIYKQNEHKYVSKLSPNFQKLYISLNFFEKETKLKNEIMITLEAKWALDKLFDENQKAREDMLNGAKILRELNGTPTKTEQRQAFQKGMKERAEAKAKLIKDKDSE